MPALTRRDVLVGVAGSAALAAMPAYAARGRLAVVGSGWSPATLTAADLLSSSIKALTRLPFDG
jgi:hypothetical protein